MTTDTGTAEASATAETETATATDNGRLTVGVVALVASVPFVVLLVRAVTSSWIATGDHSLIELQTRAVGTAHTPLIGPYSRFGWNHPGPALFFGLAAPYRLFASRGHGLLFGAALIALVTTVAVVVALLKLDQSRIAAVFALIVVAALVRALGAAFIWDPWNPYIIVLPFLGLVVASWCAAAGEPRALPVIVVLASFVAQTHVSLAPEALALLAVPVVWLVATTHERDARRRLRNSAIASVVAFLVMWLLPLYQQFRPHAGNLSSLWRFWTTSHRDTAGFGEATRQIGHELSFTAPWITGNERILPFSGAVYAPRFSFPIGLIVLLVATVVAIRRRDRLGAAGCSVALTAVIVAWFSVARIVGVPFPYLLRWTWVVGAFAWLASAAALLPPIVNRIRPTLQSWVVRVLVAGALVLVVVAAVGAVRAAPPTERESVVARGLMTAAVPQLRELPQPIIVEAGTGGYDARAILGAVVSSSVEHGIDARFDEADTNRAGPERVIEPEDAKSRLFVAVGGDVGKYQRRPGYRMLAQYDSLSPAERREVDGLHALFNGAIEHLSEADLERFIASHPAEVRRLNSLGPRELETAIFLQVPNR